MCVWDICRGLIVASLPTTEAPVCLDWMKNGSTLSYSFPLGSIGLWEYESEGQSVLEGSELMSAVSLLRCDPLQSDRLAVGHTDGCLSLFHLGKEPQRRVVGVDNVDADRNNSIVSMEWNATLSDRLLVLNAASVIRLVDTMMATVVRTFCVPTVGDMIATPLCVLWLPDDPEKFMAGDTKTGILRVWSIHKLPPIKSININKNGFTALQVLPQPAVAESSLVDDEDDFLLNVYAMCVLKDTGVGVFNCLMKTWTVVPEMGHFDVISDCEFKSSSCGVLATCSFDGTVKVWDVNAMELLATSPGNEGVINSISWAPNTMDLMAVATSSNGAFIWDYTINKITDRFTSHEGMVNRVCWNKRDHQLIASSSSDHTCIVHSCVHSYGHSVVKVLQHPAAVFGCDWSLSHKNILATGCEDGIVRVFNFDFNDMQLCKQFEGHTDRVFDVRWSLLTPNLLCSSSDDMTIRVWNCNSERLTAKLQGHSNKVCGVAWSPEIPHLLFSASLDATIRAWDIRTNKCIDVVEGHGAGVYGLAIHCNHPFAFASTATDSTIRMWSLQPLFKNMQLSILACNPLYENFTTVDESLLIGNQMKMCGEKSSGIWALPNMQESSPLLLKFISELFGYPSALANLWELVSCIVDKLYRPSKDYESGVMLAGDDLKNFKAKANDMFMKTRESSRTRTTLSNEKLRTLADIQLKLGDLKLYCELMVQARDWKKALLVAPGVSLHYWKSLIERLSNDLMARGSDEILPLCMASGNMDKVAEFLPTIYTPRDALLVCQLPYEGSCSRVSKEEEQTYKTVTDSTERQKKRQSQVTSVLANQASQAGNSILAACYFLSIEHTEAAVWKLVCGHQLELAYCVGTALCVNAPTRLAAKLLARRCEKLGQRNLALFFLRQLPDYEYQVQRLCARTDGTESELKNLHKTAGLLGPAECGAKANFLKTIDEQLSFRFLSTLPYKSFNYVLKHINELLKSSSWTLSDIQKWFDLIVNVKTSFVKERLSGEQRSELLAIAAYIGGLQAIRRRYFPVVPALFSHAREMLPCLCDGVVEDELIAYKEYRRHQLDPAYKLSESVLQTVRILERKLGGSIGKSDGSDAIVVAHWTLPIKSKVHTSHFTRQRIYGPAYILDDGHTAISLSDALMWAEVNPFSPLGSGAVINPF
ncbi:WD repeat-containing protein 17-like isoform X2 [Corticium candelabrum]|uniref:WD repeat-containing protein 17-like isoform X2 n=1 Tax=Corticium candelabrum TaxID=121492 RepID=UPI002E25CE5C|nr:WD repeat-containing protein 17-like isoform X2 [Corticium candelabrum]